MAKKRASLQLTERDEAIFRHLARYRLSTTKLITQAIGEGSEDAIKQRRKKLLAEGFIQSGQLFGKLTYVQLTKDAASRVGAPDSVAAPLTAQTLARGFATLSFCLLTPDGVRRHRLTPSEVLEHELARGFGPGPYLSGNDFFLQKDGNETLFGQLVVDAGKDINALAGRCRRIIERATQTEGVKDLLRYGHFAIGIAAPTKEKAAAVGYALKERDLTHAVLIIEPVDGLEHLASAIEIEPYPSAGSG